MPKSSTPVIVVKKKAAGHAAAHGGSWKVAYADFVTAMMAFFLLMWLVAALKPDKKEELSIVFSEKKQPNPDAAKKKAVIPTHLKEAFDLSQSESIKYSIIVKIKELMTSDPLIQQNTGVTSDSSGVLMQVNNAVMFEQNAATLKPEALKILDGVIKILLEHNMELVVRGHTDDQEAGANLYPSKWELSAARAAACVRYIIEKGKISPTRLRASGYADSRPLVPNTSPQGRSTNRRVEFLYHGHETQTW